MTTVDLTRPALAGPRPVRDGLVLLGRQLRHVQRYPELTVIVLAIPVVFLLLFVLVFGDVLGAGLATGQDRGDYAAYVLPGILVMTVASIAQGTSTTVAMDATGGLLARLRTLSVSPGSILAGHALGAALQSLASMAVVLVVAVAVGFRSSAGLLDWLGVLGLLAAFSLAIAWLSVALGLLARSVESASNYPMPLVLLPFLGSGFVPAESMPGPMAWFAEHQPFTPVMDVLRGLLVGAPVDGGTTALALGWCAVLLLVGLVGARRLFTRPRRG